MINFREKNIFFILILFVLYMTYGTSEIRISTPDRYIYHYLTGDGVPTPNTTYLSFQVQACNDAHVALKSSGRKQLEIVLGGWSNSKSCFRTKIQGSCRTEHKGRILDCGKFQTFWINWKTRRIRVGKINNGTRDLLLKYRLKALLSNVEIGITTGFGASGIWIFQDRGYRTSEVRISTPDRYSYRYLTGDGVPTPNTTYLSFQVQACNDAHMALKSSGRKPLEIVLGGWSNSKSCFRTEIQGSCRTEHKGRILDCGEFQTFWIDWTTRRIRVGKTDNGIKDPLLTYRLNAALSNVEIGITTGFGASGVWVFQGPTTPTPSITTAATLSSSNSQLVELSRGASTGQGNSVAVPITLGILSVVAVALIGVFVWRKKFYKPYGHTSDVQMINPMYNEKEMNTYEIIRRSHPEDNMYTDLSPLDVTKIGDTHGYYDVAKPVQETNTHMYEDTNGQRSRYPRNPRSSRVFGQTHYDEIPGMENQTAEGNQQKYHIDDTYLVPQPSVKRR